MKTYWGNGGVVPRFLDLGTRVKLLILCLYGHHLAVLFYIENILLLFIPCNCVTILEEYKFRFYLKVVCVYSTSSVGLMFSHSLRNNQISDLELLADQIKLYIPL